MNFNTPMLKPLRVLLFPFSLIYGLIVWIRSKLFDRGVFSSASFNIPIIGVGNLTAGGTGKSPMVEFLLQKFISRFRLAVLSRGYKRKTSGYALAAPGTSALEIGDEPMLFFSKYPEAIVAVGEERLEAIPQLLHDRPDTEVIILDDAYQHRSVNAGINLLLTDRNNLFTKDWFLPTGNLRDLSSNYKRADALIVTKCNEHMDEEEKQTVLKELQPAENQKIFFTTIRYGIPYHIVKKNQRILDDKTEVLLVTGIANPKPLKKYIAEHAGALTEMKYGDHHIFTIDDWKEIKKKFDAIRSPDKMLLTTEKDSVRLLKFRQLLGDYPFYVIPIQVEFLFGQEQRFTDFITNFITGFNHRSITANA
jgi:tetraacyldisaccharide 4'-kinase